MRNGQTPIHIQRWAPADYLADEHVRLLMARRDYLTIAFYRTFIDASFVAGGNLPADPEMLAAVVSMPKRHVAKALAYCTGRLLFTEGDRIFQPRVRREVADELEFRERQRESGAKGGRKRSQRLALDEPQGSLEEASSPPAPAPVALRPSPAPIASEAVAPPALPVVLKTPEFEKAWADWLSYRREAKLQVWKSRTIAAKLAELAEWGSDAAVASIRASIANGWKGLFARDEPRRNVKASAIPCGGSSDAEKAALRNLGRKP